jgi:hypothetical protein
MSRSLASLQPGYFEIFEGAMDSGWHFTCNCPCGCRCPDIVPLHKAGDPPKFGKHWEWDGNLTHPTITPSFKRHTPCGVHFNLNAGVYTIHADGARAAPDIYSAPKT